jgi:hypothetical protein
MVAINQDYASSRSAVHPHRRRNSCTRKTPYPRSKYVRTGHRFYSPNLHTWISRDPVQDLFVLDRVSRDMKRKTTEIFRKDVQSHSAFVFVKNDPEDLVDYLGLIWIVDSANIVGSALAPGCQCTLAFQCHGQVTQTDTLPADTSQAYDWPDDSDRNCRHYCAGQANSRNP